MTTGTIKTLAMDRGFGFIAGDDGKEYFFHRSAVEGDARFDDLQEGQLVEFEPEPVAPKGPRARIVKRAASAATRGASPAAGAAAP